MISGNCISMVVQRCLRVGRQGMEENCGAKGESKRGKDESGGEKIKNSVTKGRKTGREAEREDIKFQRLPRL